MIVIVVMMIMAVVVMVLTILMVVINVMDGSTHLFVRMQSKLPCSI